MPLSDQNPMIGQRIRDTFSDCPSYICPDDIILIGAQQHCLVLAQNNFDSWILIYLINKEGATQIVLDIEN